MKLARAAGIPVAFLIGLACTPKDGQRGAVARVRGEQNPVVASCLQGCERVRACESELDVDQAALASCEADCRRVRGEGPQSTALVDRCLERPTCMGFADCIRGRPARSGPLVVPDSGARGCEPLCGQVGDCLIGMGDETPVAAARIETSCLDVCLQNTADEGLDAPMLRCGDKRYCSDLVSCVSAAWTPNKKSGAGKVEAATGEQDDCSALCSFLTRCDPNASISSQDCKMMCGPLVSMFEPGSIQSCVAMQECEAATQCLGEAASEAVGPPSSSGVSTP